MASEWEELEKLSKDELIIELVKERQIRRKSNRAIRMVVDLNYPEDRRLPVYDDEGVDEEKTTDAWARRIILYAWINAEDKGYFDVDACDLYGLDSDQFDRVYQEMVEQGLFTGQEVSLRCRNSAGRRRRSRLRRSA